MDQATLPPSAAGRHEDHGDGAPVPGVIVVFSGGAPLARAIPLATGPVELGRGEGSTSKLDDGRVSRRHAQVAFEGGRCMVIDLGSQNGTSVDGRPAAPRTPTEAQRVVRVGDSLLVPCADVRPFKHAGVRGIDGFVRGPAMQALLDEAARAARSGTTLHIRGESGTGKEGVARAFHLAGPSPARPLVAVNCATIPHAIAERLLFGAKRGAYSGAVADATGYVEEADGGTLFLDEIAELEPQVQAKLLRVLETREVTPLGASKPRKVDFAFCSATHKDLRALVATGGLREDLYFRIGRPAVTLPALRNRPEEIPALVAQELTTRPPAPAVHVSFVEQCLLRAWPGNVRELITELRAAVHAALADGNRVEARHLAATAGTVFGSAMPEARPAPAAPAAPAPPAPPALPALDSAKKRAPHDNEESRQRIEATLRANSGNVAGTARALGMHRTQLRRLLERYGITADPAGDKDEAEPTETER